MKKVAAERAARAIIANLRDRRGLKDVWNEMDRATRREIRAEIVELILSADESPPPPAATPDPRQAGLCGACPEYYCGCSACIRRCLDLAAGKAEDRG